MIVLILISLLITTLTGFAVYCADQDAGPFAFIGPENEDLWEGAHEIFANLALLLVIVHIFGVAAESLIHKENLVRAMLHGNKKMNDDSET